MTEARPNLYVMPGGVSIPQLARHFSQEIMRIEHQLATTLEPLEDHFDYVIVDTGPGWDVLAVNVMVYAPTLLCPVIMEPLAAGIEMFAPHRRNRKKARTQDGRKLRRFKRRRKVERLFAWLGNF